MRGWLLPSAHVSPPLAASALAPPQVLQQTSSSPLKEGHPRHVNGEGGEGPGGEEEGEEGEQSAREQGGKRGSGERGESTSTAGLEERVMAVQAQLAEQGQLLRALATQLGATAGGSQATS